MLAAFVCWLLAPGHLARWRRFPTFSVLLGGYVAAATAALTAHPSPAGALRLLGVASLAATALLTADLLDTDALRRRALGVVAGSTLAVCGTAWIGAALGMLGTVTPLLGTYGDLVPGAYVRVQATLGHPNLLASFLIFGWTAAAAHPAARWRAPAMAAIAVTMPLTMSRGILAFVSAMLLARSGSRWGRVVAGVWSGASLAALVALTVWDLEIDPTRPGNARFRETPGPRREAFVTALATAAAHPWTGCGPACSPATVQGFPYDAHCTPVNVAATLGVPALLLLVALVAWSGRGARSTVLWAGLVALLLDGVAQDIEDFRHLWVLVGLVEAGRLSRDAPLDTGGASSPSPAGSSG